MRCSTFPGQEQSVLNYANIFIVLKTHLGRQLRDMTKHMAFSRHCNAILSENKKLEQEIGDRQIYRARKTPR